jgi:hypothetical protein
LRRRPEGIRTAAASRLFMIRSARMHILCHCSTRGVIFCRKILSANKNIDLVAGLLSEMKSEKNVHQFILQIAGNGHFFNPVHSLAGRFFLHRNRSMFPPSLKGGFSEEHSKKTIILDHGVISILLLSCSPHETMQTYVHYEIYKPLQAHSGIRTLTLISDNASVGYTYLRCSKNCSSAIENVEL